MYSRYTPGPDGAYRRQNLAQPTAPAPIRASPPAPVPDTPPPGLKQKLSSVLPGSLDLGDVLVLLIALLLLIDAEEDLQTILITAAAFFLL